MENAWLSWAKRLQGLASTGLHYSSDDFYKERYTELADTENVVKEIWEEATLEVSASAVYGIRHKDIVAAFRFRDDPHRPSVFD